MGGFFGVISKSPCINDLFYGTDYNSHLGTKRAGMATYSADNGFKRSIHNIENSYFRNKFEDELSDFLGNSGVGVISDTDPQPIVAYSHLGKYAMVTIAKIYNIDQLEHELIQEGDHFTEMSSKGINQTEMIAKLLNKGQTFEEGIRIVHQRIKGSCSMLILTENGIIAARDYWGRTPVIMAKKDGAYAFTSETCALPNLNFERVRDLGPGEAVRITAEGEEQLLPPQKDMQICSFLWVYYGFPTSDYEGINVEKMRFDNGRMHGKDNKVEADCVCGIPDSGTGHALGFSVGRGIPYMRAITKYTPTWPRSFTPATQERRNLVAKMKLIPNRAMLQGKKIVFCDDSIVRGTQLHDNVKVLFDLGVKEAHARISCPPLVYPCPFIGFTNERSPMELITRRIIKEKEGDDTKNLTKYAKTGSPEYNYLVEKIRERLGLTSLEFNSLENIVKAIGLPKCKLCTHCFDGTSHF